MTAKSMMPYVQGNSAIRAMFEEGARLAAIYGKENVYDFSLGNPNVAAPPEVNKAIMDIVEQEDSLRIHGYNQSNSGYEDVRQTVAEHLNKLHGTAFNSHNIIMTVGAASGLNVAMKTMLDPGEEVLAFAPYFVEYGNYAKNHGATLKAVPANVDGSGSDSGIPFQPDLHTMSEMIGPKTRAIIINSPNNPTGVIYSQETIRKLAEILEEKQTEFGTEIYIISDEPYRELAYDGVQVPYVTKYYNNTVVAYSWSKSLSLPGERIGYLVLPSEMADFENAVQAANIANRVLGYVNAPTLMQLVVARCVDCPANVEAYNKNRKALYEGLTDMGYECIYPQGAFYMWMKVPGGGEDKAFCAKAKEHNILLVPGSSFACPGYVRIAYCVAYETIVNSMPSFRQLMKEVKGEK
ncbi:MAG: pyridoxal phosphate-dependent aminotransferase [Eubacteriales bacterium]|nr:pyridoxal phosphate-dependent aminotransferase [Eubacteriales bacterium]